MNIPPQRDPRLRQLYFQALDQSLDPLYQLRFQFQSANKTDQANVIDKLFRGLHHEFKQMLRPRNELYFGDTNSLEDVLDFMIWRHEADRRGIQLNRQDISELVLRETASESIDRSIQRTIEENLRRDKNFSPESFRTALADEFRVRIAKSALLGDDQANRYLTTWATPYEFWQFYKEKRTENTLAVLPIPARHKDFLAQVSQPSEKDLKDLFEKHKDQEYQADSPEPGFKVPPRIEVEWVSAKTDSEHYRKEAQRTAGLIQAGFQVMAGGGQTMSGSVAAEATAAAVPLGFDLSLINEYDFNRYRLRNASWTDESNPRLHETSIHQAGNVVAALGQMLGGSATQAPVFSSFWVFKGSAYAREMRHRVSFGTTVISTTMALAPTGPAPLISAALMDYGSPRPQLIPLSEVKDQLAEKLQEDMAKKLVQTDLGELQNKLTKLQQESRETLDKRLLSQTVNRPELIASTLGQVLGGASTGAPLALTAPTTLGLPAITNYVQARARAALVSTLVGPNPAPFLASGLAPLEKTRKAIDEAVKRYGLEHGSTRKPEDRFTIGDDEGLKLLKEAYQHYAFGERQGKDFSNLFFQNLAAPYFPQQYPQGDSTNPFLYWKTNDKPAYVPPFAEVQDKVKDWWQLDKARELAKKEAEELKAKAQGQPDAQRWLRDGTKHSEPMFLLDEVAGFVKRRTPVPTESFNSYQRYVIPAEKIEYPPEGLENELVKMNEVGQVIVQGDRPKATYYVFALVKRSQPSEFAFYREYGSASDSLLGAMEQETGYQTAYRKGIIDQLRQEAHLKINDTNREQVDEKSRSDDS